MNDKPSYHKISRNLEAVSFRFRVIRSYAVPCMYFCLDAITSLMKYRCHKELLAYSAVYLLLSSTEFALKEYSIKPEPNAKPMRNVYFLFPY